MPIFAPVKGLVAQLNSALDYGSRGYWFESSRGHLRMGSSHVSVGFFYYLTFLACSKKVRYEKDQNRSAIDCASHFHYGVLRDIQSSRGHLRMGSSHVSVGFFYYLTFLACSKKVRYEKDQNRSAIDCASHFHYGVLRDIIQSAFKAVPNSPKTCNYFPKLCNNSEDIVNEI